MKIEHADSIEFKRHRWRVRIIIHVADHEVEYVADASLQSGDAIWFGTAEEHAEAERDAYDY